MPNDMFSSFLNGMIALLFDFTILKLRNEENGDVRFTSEIKLLSLLNAIGTDGLEVLCSVGFNGDAHNTNYDNALLLL